MSSHIKQIKRILLFFAIILGLYLLKVLSSLIIPLVLAFFISLLLYPIIKWLTTKRVPYWASVIISILLVYLIVDITVISISSSMSDFTNHKEELTAQAINKLAPVLKLTDHYLMMDFSAIYEQVAPFIIKNLPTDVVFEFAGNAFLTTLYLIFILTGNILKTEKNIRLIISNDEASNEWVDVYREIRKSITKYMIVKGVISLLTGLGYTLACYAFGVKFAPLWGFLAFLLNFIPNVGSLIATVPPLLLGWLEIETTTLLFVYASVLIAVQQVFGNIIEPYWMGKSFSLNTIAVLFGLVLCTFIWGIIGAVLAVPILVFIKIILQHIPSAGVFARLLENH